MEKLGEIMKTYKECNNCVHKICDSVLWSCERVNPIKEYIPKNTEPTFELMPLSEILEEESCKIANNNLAIFKQIQNKSHLCHYTKFQLDYDINTSIRFIHAFDDRPELVGKFIYKHHEEKLFSVIEPQLAEHFIKTQCSNEAEEFINRYVGQGKGKKYRRIKVTENSLTKYFES